MKACVLMLLKASMLMTSISISTALNIKVLSQTQRLILATANPFN